MVTMSSSYEFSFAESSVFLPIYERGSCMWAKNSFHFDYHIPAGPHHFVATVDPSDQIFENNEANNETSGGLDFP